MEAEEGGTGAGLLLHTRAVGAGTTTTGIDDRGTGPLLDAPTTIDETESAMAPLTITRPPLGTRTTTDETATGPLPDATLETITVRRHLTSPTIDLRPRLSHTTALPLLTSPILTPPDPPRPTSTVPSLIRPHPAPPRPPLALVRPLKQPSSSQTVKPVWRPCRPTRTR